MRWAVKMGTEGVRDSAKSPVCHVKSVPWAGETLRSAGKRAGQAIERAHGAVVAWRGEERAGNGAVAGRIALRTTRTGAGSRSRGRPAASRRRGCRGDDGLVADERIVWIDGRRSRLEARPGSGTLEDVRLAPPVRPTTCGLFVCLLLGRRSGLAGETFTCAQMRAAPLGRRGGRTVSSETPARGERGAPAHGWVGAEEKRQRTGRTKDTCFGGK